MNDERDPLRESLRGLPPLTPPPGFYDRVLKETRRSRWLSGAFPRVLATAAVLTIVVWATLDVKHKRSARVPQNQIERGAVAKEEVWLLNQDALLEKKKDNPAAFPPRAILAGKTSLNSGPPASSGISADSVSALAQEPKDHPQMATRNDDVTPATVRSKYSSANKNIALEEVERREQNHEAMADKGMSLQSAPAVVPGSIQMKSAARGERAMGQGYVKIDNLGALAKDRSVAITPQEWRGVWSGVSKAKTVVCRTASEWKKLWAEHAPGAVTPDVDFKKGMVVGVFAGTRNSGGYVVDILDVQEKSDRVTVFYKEVKPGAGMGQIQALTQPHHLRVVPRTSKPVRFRGL